jgi:hypothetical protein
MAALLRFCDKENAAALEFLQVAGILPLKLSAKLKSRASFITIARLARSVCPCRKGVKNGTEK